MKYQLEGQYPKYYLKVPLFETVNNYLCNTKVQFEGLSKML